MKPRLRIVRKSYDSYIVVIGGGTGSFTLLQSLKSLSPNITALVSMADDGGSTGVLRDELGALPPGDVRQCLVALSDTPKMRDLFDYRFDAGKLDGHSFGNLLLSALEKMTGNFGEAVETASEILNITGKVVPITLDSVRLIMDAPGIHIEGQHQADKTVLPAQCRPIITLMPAPKVNPDAVAAIEKADIIVLAPGDIYTSLAPALVVPGIAEALAVTKAKLIYVCNLVVKPEHTKGMTVSDHAAEIERFLGGKLLDFVLYNIEKPDKQLLQKYAADQEFMVEPDKAVLKTKHYTSIAAKLIADEPAVHSRADKLAYRRSFIRHDGRAVGRQIKKLSYRHRLV